MSDMIHFLSLFSNMDNLWTEDEQHNLEKIKYSATTTTKSTVDVPKEHSDSGIQQSGTSVDDETTTDWTPEIPFENLHNGTNEADDDYMDNQNCSCAVQGFDGTFDKRKKPPVINLSTEEEIEEIMDHSIEIESNKRMRDANLNPWTLRFKDPETECKFYQLREDMFKSNMLCCFVIWIFILSCNILIFSGCSDRIYYLIGITFLITATTSLVMAEEFEQLPVNLQKLSSKLVRNRNSRTTFMCGVLTLMSIAVSLSLFLCASELRNEEKSEDDYNFIDPAILYLKSDAPILISNLNIYENGAVQNDTPGNYSLAENLSKNIRNDMENNRQAIILNLFLTATIHHNITFNGGKILNTNVCNTECMENIVKEVLKKSKDIYYNPNITYTDGTFSENDFTLEEKLNFSMDTNDINCILNKDKCINNHYPRIKRSIVQTSNEISKDIIMYEHEKNESTTVESTTESINQENNCKNPEYIVFMWVLCLIALATALKLYYLLKTFIAIIMVFFYTIFIIYFFPDTFQNKPGSLNTIPLWYQMLALLIVFFIMVAYHARLVEVTSRLDFLWKQQAERELTDMIETRHNNTQLLKNILPDHVAQHFLKDERAVDELYSQARSEVGVLFASIPNFTKFYSEDINKGMECIRLLNEIIADFDELLDEPRFSCIEKIKTVGSTYMAASGLNPTQEDSSNSENLEHLCALIDFAIAMKQRLDDVNTHSFNNFGLRVGVSCGALVGGVIGARKPVFDIWGDTVNEASRMDSTGVMGKIQVPKYTAQLLGVRGYDVKIRGIIEVKGKGPMETYFVLGRSSGRTLGFTRQSSQYNSLAAVMYALANARRRQTFNTPGVLSRTKSQYKQEGPNKLFNYSSVRLNHRTPANPVRRNTTRAHQRNLHARSQPNMRQLEPGGITNSRKTSVRDKEITRTSYRTQISQSAPHTPVSAPSYENDGVYFKSVPRLLSEPLVNSNGHSPSQKSVNSDNLRRSPYMTDKKSEKSELSTNEDDNNSQDRLKQRNAQNVTSIIVPVHSSNQTTNKDSAILKSPLVKKDTKLQLDNSNIVHAKVSPTKTDLEITNV